MSKPLFIQSKRELNEFLDFECKIYNFKKPHMPLICLRERDFLWKYNYLLRKTEYYINTNNKILGLIFKVLLSRYQNIHQIHIPINTFDKGLKLMHLGPMLVHNRVVGGKNIALHINTSIAAGGTDDEVPTLGDEVVVGVGASIIGGVQLANGIAIGANAMVNKSFQEENIAIAGVPAKKNKQ